MAYILGTFPSISEAFILDEIIGLESKGIDIIILALRSSQDKKCHERAKALAERAIYRPSLILVEQWKILFHCLFKQPILFFQLILIMFKGYKSSPPAFLKLFRNLPCAFYFTEHIKKAGVHHIHAHFAYIPATVAMIISKVLNIPFSFSAHAWDIHTNRANLKEEFSSAHFIITCSEQNRLTLLSRYTEELSDKIHKVYHGVNFEYWGNEPKRCRLEEIEGERSLSGIWSLMAAGRLIEKKGFDFLIKACALLKEKKVRFHLALIGEGQEKPALEKLAGSLGLENEITFAGAMTHEELRQYYFRADIFVLPCVVAKDGDRDGLPNVLLEAMAAGVPVISTGISAIPELIEDGKTGILVRESDEKGLCEAIYRLINLDDLRSDIIEKARVKVREEFNLQNSVDKLYHLFKGTYC